MHAGVSSKRKTMAAKRYKASSLLNAVYVCLVIAIFCSALVFLSHFNATVYSRFEGRAALLDGHQSDVGYFLTQWSPENTTLTRNEEGRTSIASITPWGGYQKLNVTSSSNADEITKTMLVGAMAVSSGPSTALFLADRGTPMKYSGNTNLVGALSLPKKKIDQNYINGLKNRLVQRGAITEAGPNIPELDGHQSNNEGEGYLEMDFDEILSLKSYTQPFEEQTVFVSAPEPIVIEDVEIRGNVIVNSLSEIHIAATALLQDIIIRAPKITVASGFKGIVQLESEERIFIEENVVLQFPSGIRATNKLDSTVVKIGKRSKIEGYISMTGEDYQRKEKCLLVMEEGSQLLGDAYCNGYFNFKGSVYGTVYTDHFMHATSSSTTANLLVNGTINSDSLHLGFPRLRVRTRTNEYRYATIKEF